MILTMIGAMAIPLFMLILGGNIYNDYRQNKTQGQGIYWSEIIKFVLIKNFLFPAIFLALLIWLKPDFPLALIIILQAAVPPITAVPLFSERSGGNRAIANQFSIFSFLVSIITYLWYCWYLTTFSLCCRERSSLWICRTFGIEKTA
jgi:predicted permease